MKPRFTTAILSTVILMGSIVWGCKKNYTGNIDKHQVQTISSEFEMTNAKGKNYCKGCGTAYINTFHCEGNECLENNDCSETEAMSYVSSPTPEQAKSKDSMYGIRDSFLVNFEHGQWYITYYYELSKVAHNKQMINAGNYLTYINLAKDLLNVAHSIRYGAGNEVPVEKELSTKLEALIGEFRSNTTDPVILQYLNNIHSDLVKYTNKDVSYIRAGIGM